MVKAQKFTLARHFEGLPTSDNFNLVEEHLPEIKEDEILVEALYLSVDPYMRPYASRMLKEGDTMLGEQVGRVIESKNKRFPIGTLVAAHFGWRTHTIANPRKAGKEMRDLIQPLPALGNLSPSLGLGAIGMPGNTAYFGFLEICQPKAGDVVVVSGAAGAVGSLVGQIAKLKGCFVIGFAGSDDKVKWLVEELSFDKAYNYKTVDWNAALSEAAPEGVDCYFDNVGGTFSSTVRMHMKNFGRISVCGAISTYNDLKETPSMAPCCESMFVFKQLKMEGFLVHRWLSRWMEGLIQMTQWIQEGKIKIRETYTEGFAKMPQAFIEMLQGKNTGKAIVKV